MGWVALHLHESMEKWLERKPHIRGNKCTRHVNTSRKPYLSYIYIYMQGVMGRFLFVCLFVRKGEDRSREEERREGMDSL